MVGNVAVLNALFDFIFLPDRKAFKYCFLVCFKLELTVFIRRIVARNLYRLRTLRRIVQLILFEYIQRVVHFYCKGKLVAVRCRKARAGRYLFADFQVALGRVIVRKRRRRAIRADGVLAARHCCPIIRVRRFRHFILQICGKPFKHSFLARRKLELAVCVCCIRSARCDLISICSIQLVRL